MQNITYKIIEYKNAKYEGGTLDDKKEGKGKIVYGNGDKFDGNFMNDKKEGRGIYYYS